MCQVAIRQVHVCTNSGRRYILIVLFKDMNSLILLLNEKLWLFSHSFRLVTLSSYGNIAYKYYMIILSSAQLGFKILLEVLF